MKEYTICETLKIMYKVNNYPQPIKYIIKFIYTKLCKRYYRKKLVECGGNFMEIALEQLCLLCTSFSKSVYQSNNLNFQYMFLEDNIEILIMIEHSPHRLKIDINKSSVIYYNNDYSKTIDMRNIRYSGVTGIDICNMILLTFDIVLEVFMKDLPITLKEKNKLW